jgi:hypothetical protein
MRRLRIVKTKLTAVTYNQGTATETSFDPGDVLIFLRAENGTTFFARLEDIPANQPDPPWHLPEYELESSAFGVLTRQA